jgi:hypothetical protein
LLLLLLLLHALLFDPSLGPTSCWLLLLPLLRLLLLLLHTLRLFDPWLELDRYWC